MSKHLFLFWSLFSLFATAQQTENIDFLRGEASLTLNPYKKEVTGEVEYLFKALKNTDSILVDARQMEILSLTLNGKKTKYSYNGSEILISRKLKPDTQYTLKIAYQAVPKKAMYFIGWEFEEARNQVWTQGQGKYTSNWLPCFDDMNEKVEFDLNITFNKNYEVIANGNLVGTKIKDSLKTWHYDMTKPMSSYLLAVAIGKYKVKTMESRSKIPIHLYYYPEDSLKFEPTYRYTKQIFDFLEEEIGVPYPWQNYKEVPVKDFMYAGMENTSATIFSDSYVVDSTSFIDKNFVNINAHELAHQWFGDLVTEKSGKHHWLHEGFATYYALLAEKEIFGEEYYYWKLYESAQRLSNMADEGKEESLLDSQASSLTFYEKGALVLHELRKRVGGAAFRAAVKNYLNKYKFKNVTVDDFINEVEKTAGTKLDDFVNTYLKQADNIWIKNKTNELREAILQNDNAKAINFISFKQLVHVDKELKDTLNDFKKTYAKILSSKDIKARQALVSHTDTISAIFKKDFETFLDDKSYVTVESALYKLWLNFPEDRALYLNKTKNTTGFNDKNIRILWLSLALATPDYNEGMKQAYFNELSGYTSPFYHFEIRQNAFIWLFQLQIFSDENLKDLVNATRHSSWQFAKFSKELLDILLANDAYKKRFVDLMNQLNKEEANYLQNKIKNQ
ncbi:M1 family metallopeptidase [Abyssalbus ytuae]|uniref:Aminopeptidase N n=1 Tax=Abyssalbus ytuae TaxID=2926907 RepID=A0A9E6ZT26_9FLAO|nr:M1 family metallopeptidase [Abyssalbus ytuae]UOB17323.1 M1 family metallopeptidase [Abyssalbus ytuae]